MAGLLKLTSMKHFMLAIAVLCCVSHCHADTLITGLVRDRVERPVRGAKVSAVYLSRRPPNDPLYGGTVATEARCATTDALGRFEIRLRSSTAQDIALELSSHFPGEGVAFADLRLDRSEHELTLTLPTELRIPVVLLDPNRQPLPRARAKVSGMVVAEGGGSRSAMYSAPADGVSAWPGPYQSDDDGRVTLVAGGSIRDIRLDVDDERVAKQRWMVVATNNNEPLVLCTKPPRLITGQVVAGDTREPIADATVVITTQNGDEFSFVGNDTVTTDVEGRFSLRPFVGNTLSIRVTVPGERFESLRRTIPWLHGTRTQRMVLPIYGPGFHPVDGTSADGRQATTIDDEFPDCAVTELRPRDPLTAPLPGAIFADVSLTTPGNDELSATGVIAIDAESGRWRLLAAAGRNPRVSPDGKRLAYVSGLVEPHVEILDLEHEGPTRTIAEMGAGPVCWLPDSQEFVTNFEDASPRDYFGQEYWPLDSTKRRLDLAGNARAMIPVPPSYGAYDVSPDGRWMAMHWDSHSSETAAQLYCSLLDGSQLQPIACRKFHYYWYPRFRPDGGAVLAKHLNARGGQASIRIIELDGSAERDIALDSGYAPEFACWSPDGAFIAIAAINEEGREGGPKHSKLFIVNADGTQLTEIQLADAEELRIYSLDWTSAFPVAK